VIENIVKDWKESEYKNSRLGSQTGRKISVGHKEHTEYTRNGSIFIAESTRRKKGLR